MDVVGPQRGRSAGAGGAQGGGAAGAGGAQPAAVGEHQPRLRPRRRLLLSPGEVERAPRPPAQVRPRSGGSRGGAGVPLTAGVCGSAAAVRRDAEEAAARLQRRRERLERLLGEEQEALAAELRERQRGRMRSQELRDGPGECGGKVRERPVLFPHAGARSSPVPAGLAGVGTAWCAEALVASAGFGMLTTPGS